MTYVSQPESRAHGERNRSGGLGKKVAAAALIVAAGATVAIGITVINDDAAAPPAISEPAVRADRLQGPWGSPDHIDSSARFNQVHRGRTPAMSQSEPESGPR